MNPHAAHAASFKDMAGTPWAHRQLIKQMVKREVTGRYKGSILGLTWSFFNPIFMLIVYTFVFSVIFKSRWSINDEGKTQFALMLFVGLIVANLFGEVINRAPSLILSNVNYVKKVVFPIEILPLVSMAAALFHSVASLAVLLLAFYIINGHLHWTIFLIPAVFLPFVILTTGIAWIMASLGVFLRDVGQFVAIAVTVMTFLAPVFYPISAVPEQFVPFILLNPLTFIIEQAREVLIHGNAPNWRGLSLYTFIACFVAWIGFAWFQKTRKGFADVL